MELEHNSRDRFYRKPEGAVTCGTNVRLRLLVSGAGIPKAVRLVYRPDGREEVRVDMPYYFTLADFCAYSCTVKMPEKPGLIWYYFELETDQGMVYYGNNPENLGGIGTTSFRNPDNAYQITVYNENYQTPDWFKTGVAYQIFVDRFCNGNEDGSFLGNRTDIIKRNWGDQPFYKAEQFGGEYLANDFFGGNLKGIIKKLDYLKDLGISVLYLNPIFKAYSNHKYDTGDYEEIDPMFGDEETFRSLCAEANKRGIRIILDGVFNHTGSNSKYFNKNGEYDSIGAYQSKDSPYYDWYRFSDFPEEYESWWGMKTLPHLEEQSESVQEYLLTGKNAIIKRWLRAGASGWRLDVVDELPGFFVKKLRAAVKEEKADAVIIGEVWEDASNKSSYGERREYFLGQELDSVMNYPLKNLLIDAALSRINADTFDKRIMSLKENYPAPAFYSLLNMVSSHDVERILTVMGDIPSRHHVDKEFQANFKLDGYGLETAKERCMLLVGMQMTLPGVPCVFYGDEVGMQGYADPFCRGCFPWDWVNEDNEILRRYKQYIDLRNRYTALSTGEFATVYKLGYVYGYIRWDEKDAFIILCNFGTVHEQIRLDAAKYGVRNMSSVFGDEQRHADDGMFIIDMPSRWIKVFKVEKEETNIYSIRV